MEPGWCDWRAVAGEPGRGVTGPRGRWNREDLSPDSRGELGLSGRPLGSLENALEFQSQRLRRQLGPLPRQGTLNGPPSPPSPHRWTVRRLSASEGCDHWGLRKLRDRCGWR